MKGDLYIVATPIGNLEDITLRAIRVLKEIDLIAAEDTRHSKKLLNHYGISKPIISYWGEKEKVKSKLVIDKLKSGLSVALITDAGTPGISDPGEVLIKDALREGITIIPVPGPSAIVTALSVSGLSTKRFFFIGFLSNKPSKRKKELKELLFEEKTLVIYESPHRLVDFFHDLLDVFGDRKVALCHEMTKFHEEVIRGSVSDVIEIVENRKIAGEYVILVEGAKNMIFPIEDALHEVNELIKQGKSRRIAVAEVAHVTGLGKKLLYHESLRFPTTFETS